MNNSTLEIKKIRKELKVSQAKLAEMLGVSLRTVQNYEAGTVIPETTMKLLRSLVAPNYKVQRDSPILKENYETFNEPNAIWVEYGSFKLIPLISHRAQAGFLSGYGDDDYINELPKIPWEVDKEYKGRYLCFEVAGDSMESDVNPRESIFDGSLLLCREVQQHHWSNRLHIHKWDFVIVHKTDGILCKRIIQHDTKTGTLTLHSLNPYYEDFNINLNDVMGIYNIVDVKRSRRR